MTKVYKDNDGNIVNIGDWDFRMKPTFDENGIQIFNKDGVAVLTAVNPIPDGVYEDDVEIILGQDGKFYEANGGQQ